MNNVKQGDLVIVSGVKVKHPNRYVVGEVIAITNQSVEVRGWRVECQGLERPLVCGKHTGQAESMTIALHSGVVVRVAASQAHAQIRAMLQPDFDTMLLPAFHELHSELLALEEARKSATPHYNGKVDEFQPTAVSV